MNNFWIQFWRAIHQFAAGRISLCERSITPLDRSRARENVVGDPQATRELLLIAGWTSEEIDQVAANLAAAGPMYQNALRSLVASRTHQQ